MHIEEFSQLDDWIDAATFSIGEIMKDGGNLALSGGSTPRPIYESLIKQDLPWELTNIFQVDERYVPADHPDSNQKMINDALANHVPTNFIPFNTTLPLTECISDYSNRLAPLNLCILGIGTDGHTASLFPNSPALNERSPVTATETGNSNFAINQRLTLTFPTIMASKHLLVLLKGQKKLEVLQELQEGQKTLEEFPSKRLLSHPKLNILFCGC